MLSKTKIVLSALLVVGFTSAALAAEDPEARVGDRYPFLEQMAAQEDTGLGAYAYVPAPGAVMGYTASEKALFDRADEAIGW
jgi:hypothetical protein